ncbi:MAG: hypothetical protein OXI95_03220 [bacterium]|nr:hypothetical protein [bacterium]
MRRTLIAAALVALTMPARAEPGPIGQWLMEQPVSLWDWGMMRAKENAQRAADQIAGAAGRWASLVRYNWDTNQIEIGLSANDYRGDASHENCNEVRHSFVRALASSSLPHDASEEKIREWTYRSIDEWFSHEGFSGDDRDEKLAEKLARIIFVVVQLRDAENATQCRARITTLDAPSEPIE